MPYELLNTSDINSVNNNANGIGVIPKTSTAFPFEKTTAYSDQVRENLTTVLLTTRGERVYQPMFGCNLETFLFNPISEELKDLISQDIYTAVNMWIPDATILEIDIQTYEEDPSLNHEISITIKWSLENDTETREPITIFSDNGIITTG